jgi:hypothetical protein
MKTPRSPVVNLVMAVALMAFNLVAAGCGSSGSQPSTNSTPNGAY